MTAWVRSSPFVAVAVTEGSPFELELELPEDLLLEQFGQCGDGACGQNFFRRQGDVEYRLGSRSYLQATEGVAAELEEVVLGPDPGDAQHLGPDRRQGGLGVGAGGDVAG